MKRVCLIIAILAAALAIYYEFGTAAYADGSYEVMVDFELTSPEDISSIFYIPVNDDELARQITHDIPKHLEYMEHLKSAEPFVINAGFSYRMSPLGRRWGHVQEFSHLIVVVKYNDGSSETHKLQVPHRDQQTHIVVSEANRIVGNSRS